MPPPDESLGSQRPPSLLSLPSYLAGSVARLGNSALVGLLRTQSLRLPQFAVLSALSDFGALAPHELATRLQTDRSHISTYVESLLPGGWVMREQDSDDRRRVTVTLTESGRLRFGELARAASASETSFLSALSSEEQATLQSLLLKVIASAEAAASDSEELAQQG